MSEEVNFGDGIYAYFNGLHICLECLRDGRTQRVALGPHALAKLNALAARSWPALVSQPAS